jgi:hypothetical protein
MVYAIKRRQAAIMATTFIDFLSNHSVYAWLAKETQMANDRLSSWLKYFLIFNVRIGNKKNCSFLGVCW